MVVTGGAPTVLLTASTVIHPRLLKETAMLHPALLADYVAAVMDRDPHRGRSRRSQPAKPRSDRAA
jgi:hypothetical protein